MISLTGIGDSFASDGVCKHHTAPRALYTHKHFLACGSRRWTGSSTLHLCPPYNIHSSFSCVMSHLQSLWSDLPPFRLPQHMSSLLYPSHSDEAPHDPRTEGRTGRLAVQSPLTSGGDIVKDDSGSYAVFPEQGSSASQLTAAKVVDVKARLPGCAGQAADAVSATPKSRWRMHQHCWNFPSQNVQKFGYVYNGMSGPNHGPTLKNRLFLLSEICMVTIFLDYHKKDNLKKLHSDSDGREYQNGNACLFIVSKIYSCRFPWMTSN